ncbi:Fucose-1-phosphate guanylyltransferase [Chionoecetes opilio]|uniref:Fucose-1-phosphate guanylyltransferase n=1 Tax=Chionoecetes opilio TaxID=41210 RepID=A0A8J5CGL1_CHIOP|nr:Fucose-1-phosphate guanylyltransferase [Chionoecetes opilio]
MMKNPASHEIQRAMRQIFETYSTLRDKDDLLDIVVLTTCDEAQRSCFQEQVARKRASCELPQIPFYVVADPPDQKLGVGGSTLHVLSELMAEFGVELYNKKVLIIHSGLSKGHGVPQMLDLKLAMYLPLCRLLGPGILVTCADDIETYCLDHASLDTLWHPDTESLGRADVVALGHPSPLGVGRGHGVYVLQGGGVGVCGGGSVVECVEVLQKPSLEAMRSSGAVFCRGGGGSKQEEEEQVWSDSVFWLSSGVCRRLLKWYVENRPLSGELDAYAHILPCLGARMETAIPDDYTDYRAQMLPLLRGASFKVIALPQSKFYHMGTMGEYVANFNTAEDFISELGIDRNTSNVRGKVELVNFSICDCPLRWLETD